MYDKNETKENILIEAKKEFLEKGYEQASLRSICKNAGCTTGALYFFFEDKNDLFGSLVQEQLDILHKFIEDHFAEEVEEVNNINEHLQKYSYESDMAVTMQVCDHIYDNFDTFELLVMKADGSKYENYIDEMILYCDKHYRLLADTLSKLKKIPPISEQLIHWISHIDIEIYIHLISHKIPREEAKILLLNMMEFIRNGWFGMFKDK